MVETLWENVYVYIYIHNIMVCIYIYICDIWPILLGKLLYQLGFCASISRDPPNHRFLL